MSLKIDLEEVFAENELTQDTKHALGYLRLDTDSLKAIGRWDQLVKMLNLHVARFVMTYGSPPSRPPFVPDQTIIGGKYDFNGYKQIHIGAGKVDNWNEFSAVLVLVHEATHAMQDLAKGDIGADLVKCRIPDPKAKNQTLAQYIEKVHLYEGEARYNEWQALTKLYGGNADYENHFNLERWIKGDAKSMSNIYSEITTLAGQYSDMALFREIGKINAELQYGTIDKNNRVELTYDEMWKWHWLTENQSSLLTDYMEAWGKNYTNWHSAKAAIIGSEIYSYDMKV